MGKHRRPNFTPRQERYIEEYLKDLCGAKAARRAGYSPKTAKLIAVRLMKTPAIRKEIEHRIKHRTAMNEITVDRVLREYAAIGFSNPLHYMRIGKDGLPEIDLSDLPEQYAKAIAEVYIVDDDDGGRKIKFKLHDKVGALRDMGRYLAMFTDTVNVNVDEGLANRIAEARRRTNKK